MAALKPKRYWRNSIKLCITGMNYLALKTSHAEHLWLHHCIAFLGVSPWRTRLEAETSKIYFRDIFFQVR